MEIRHSERTHVGSIRSVNQDALFVDPERNVFLVADGMGGQKAGEIASAQVVESVRRHIEAFLARESINGLDDIETMACAALAQANNDVVEQSRLDPKKQGMGSTGSLLCLYRGLYFIAHVGDSRVYLLRDGRIQQLTCDHTLVWELYKKGAISRDELNVHPKRNVLNQCLGCDNRVSIDTMIGNLYEGDLFLLCTDGLNGFVDDDQIGRHMDGATTSLKQGANSLVNSALQGGGGDNVSVILVSIDHLDDQDDWRGKVTEPLFPDSLGMPSRRPRFPGLPPLDDFHRPSLSG